MSNADTATVVQTVITMTLAAYADWLGAQVTAAGERNVRVWHGDTCHRVYRGEDYVTVSAGPRAGSYGHAVLSIVGRDRGFSAALRGCGDKVVSYCEEDGTVDVSV